jgi:hypothetical protein
MGVPTSEVSYTFATARRGDHESSYEHVVALERERESFLTDFCEIWCMTFPRNTAKQLIYGFVNTDEVKATLYLRVFARIFYVFYKSGKGDIHERLLREGECRENRRIGSHTFLRSAHEFLSVLSTFIFRPG